MTRSRSAKTGRASKRPRAPAKPAARRAAEVCTELGIQPYVLKFWESEIPDLGDRVGSERLYGPKELALVRRIREMVEEQRLDLVDVRRRLAGRAGASGGRPAGKETSRGRAERPRSGDQDAPTAELRSARARIVHLEGELRELLTVRADRERLEREVERLRRELVGLDGLGAPRAAATGGALPDGARAEIAACLDEARRLGSELDELLVALGPADAGGRADRPRRDAAPPRREDPASPGLFPEPA